ncbi:hypothetical protein niasHT_008104 [Heterodera trifolii]|uniref:Uncharacterized protein n=1 Tax=Heterodera trifolii TaxID=157864 RepID=A0ABD2M004_9BILA
MDRNRESARIRSVCRSATSARSLLPAGRNARGPCQWPLSAPLPLLKVKFPWPVRANVAPPSLHRPANAREFLTPPPRGIHSFANGGAPLLARFER